MSFTPDEANDRMHELGKKHAAKVLYGAYCRYRNTLTGRTNVHNETLAERAGIEQTQVSASKTDLLDAGWIVRDPEALRYGVIPVMGAREFQNRRAWKFQGMKEDARWAFLNQKVKVWNYVKSELVAASFPILSMRADSSDWDKPNLTGSTFQPSELCDADYLERVIQALRYPPELDERDVRRVYAHFTFDCADRQQPPTKKLFLGYLRREAEEKLRRGQLTLPATGGAPMVEPRFDAAERYRRLKTDSSGVRYPLRPDPQCEMCEGSAEFKTSGGLYCKCRVCQLCFGVGTQILKEGGAKKCPHLTGEADERKARTG
jgi:hypothetical protein